MTTFEGDQNNERDNPYRATSIVYCLSIVLGLTAKIYMLAILFCQHAKKVSTSGGQNGLRLSVYSLSASQFLELESDSELNLPLAEERAVGGGDCRESVCGARVEIQRCHRMCRRYLGVQYVHVAVDAGDQQGVGQIEHLAQELQIGLL